MQGFVDGIFSSWVGVHWRRKFAVSPATYLVLGMVAPVGKVFGKQQYWVLGQYLRDRTWAGVWDFQDTLHHSSFLKEEKGN